MLKNLTLSQFVDRSNGKYYLEENRLIWPELPSLKLKEGEAYSVTHILKLLNKPALLPWAVALERKFILECLTSELSLSKDATLAYAGLKKRLDGGFAYNRSGSSAINIGQVAHNEIEKRLKANDLSLEFEEKKDGISDKVKIILGGFAFWANEVDLKPAHTEIIVCNNLHRYAGTVDCVAMVNGKKTLIDWKSSSAIYPEYKLQVAAYAYCMNQEGDEDFGTPVEQCAIVRFPKDEKQLEKMDVPFEVAYLSDVEMAYYFKKFLAVKHAFTEMLDA